MSDEEAISVEESPKGTTEEKKPRWARVLTGVFLGLIMSVPFLVYASLLLLQDIRNEERMQTCLAASQWRLAVGGAPLAAGHQYTDDDLEQSAEATTALDDYVNEVCLGLTSSSQPRPAPP